MGIRIFNSWVDAYAYPMGAHGVLDEDHTFHRYPGKYDAVPMGYHNPGNPKLTGTPFNDAYRYMDWLLTVPLLLMEIVMVMNLPPEESSSRCWTLGAGAALMIVSVGQLLPLVCLLPLHCVHPLGGPQRRDELRDRSRGEAHDRQRTGLDLRQLVHLPDRVPFPHDGYYGQRGGDLHPDRLLRFGYHLEVWCRPHDLPDHDRQVQERRKGHVE